MNWKRCKQCLSLLAMGALVLALLSGCGTTEKDSGGDPAKLSSFEAEVIRLVNERPDGSSCFTVLPEFGIRYETAGENIAAGQKTPAQVVRAWMNSEGHRNNILNPDFTQIGVGYTYTGRGYRHFWAQTFIG